VYKICNFSKRRYAKTFPGIEYWLSIVPVLPLVEFAVKEFCCSVLENLFGRRFRPPLSHANIPGGPDVTGYNIMQVTERLRTFKFGSIRNAVTGRLSLAIAPTLDWAKGLFRTGPAVSTGGVGSGMVRGQAISNAQTALQRANVAVTVRPYDPGNIAFNLQKSLTAPDTIPAGSSVTLFTDPSGKVRTFSVAPPDVSAMSTEISALQASQASLQTGVDAAKTMASDVAALKAQLANLQAAHTKELAARDQQIATLTTTTQQLQSSLADVRTQLGRIAPPGPRG
jgi:hypothetical protein